MYCGRVHAAASSCDQVSAQNGHEYSASRVLSRWPDSQVFSFKLWHFFHNFCSAEIHVGDSRKREGWSGLFGRVFFHCLRMKGVIVWVSGVVWIGLLPYLNIFNIDVEESDEPGLCNCMLVGVPVRWSGWIVSWAFQIWAFCNLACAYAEPESCEPIKGG